MSIVYQLDNLTYSYNGQRVIDIPSYSIRENNTIALVGHNGSGKSTLMSLLAYLLEPETGEVRLFGELPASKRHETRKRVGYVQQSPYLFNMSVLENIELGLKFRGVNKLLRKGRASSVLEQLQIDHLANKRAHELSGGEVQKVALASVLVLEPEVILLDEPFTYLDKNFANELEALLLNIRENRSQTVIFSSHDSIRARLIADRVCKLEKGKLSEVAPVNIFHGNNTGNPELFRTREISIIMADIHEPVNMVAIDADQIVLARNSVDTSMRNQFRGEIDDIDDHGEHVMVTVNVGETFIACISHAARRELGLAKGQGIWVSFKSSAIRILND